MKEQLDSDMLSSKDQLLIISHLAMPGVSSQWPPHVTLP